MHGSGSGSGQDHRRGMVAVKKLVIYFRGVNELVWIRFEGKTNSNRLILMGLVSFGFMKFFEQIRTKLNLSNSS